MASSGSLSTSGYNGRYLVFQWEQVSQSISNNTTTISWKLTGAGAVYNSSGQKIGYYTRNITVKIAGTTVYNAYTDGSYVTVWDGTEITSGTLTLAHDDNGSKTFSVSVAAGIYNSSPTCTGSGTFDLNRIARLSGLYAENGTLGTEQTLTVTKQSDDDKFTHTITYKCGTANETIVKKSSSTSINWTPPIDLANQNTTGTLVSIIFTIETFYDGTSIGSLPKTISCIIPDSVRPTCVINVERVPLVTDYYDADWWMNNDVYIQGITKVQSNIVANESYGSSISSYSIKMGNLAYNGQNVTMAAPSNSGNVTITATVTDKRGQPGSATKIINVLPCPSCQITKLSGIRCNNDGTPNDRGEYILMNYAYDSGFFTTEYGSNNGSAMAEVYYKKHSDSAWTLLAQQYDIQHFPPSSWTSDEVKAASLFQADPENSYDLKLVVSDYFNTVTMTGRVGAAYSLIHWKASGKGIGIGKTSELDDVLDIGMSTKFSGGITPIELESGTDLNDVVLPNVYYGNGISDNYPNFPMSSTSSVGFSLEVLKSGTSTIKQRLTVTNAIIPSSTDVYERIRGNNALGTFIWSSWVCTSTPDIIPISNGGTGATTQATALANLKALPLAGGTMDSGSIIDHPGNATTWKKGRDYAILRRPNAVSDSKIYYPLVSSKTTSGDWTMATYGNQLQFNYVADSDSSRKLFLFNYTGDIYCEGNKKLIASGTLGASASSTISGSFNGNIYKNLLIVIRSVVNNGNQYSSFVVPSIADTWHFFLPTYNDYYRTTVTTTGSGANMKVTVRMDSNVSSTPAYVYGTI